MPTDFDGSELLGIDQAIDRTDRDTEDFRDFLPGESFAR
jgi:hypothetical protein